MLFFEYVRSSGSAVAQAFLLGAVGYILMKREFLGEQCLNTLSRLTMDITLPAMIFCSLIRDFSFSAYPRWLLFPLASIGLWTIARFIF